jgi:hypothetical protein
MKDNINQVYHSNIWTSLSKFRKTVLLCFWVFLFLYIAGCKGNSAPDTPSTPSGPSNGEIGNYTFSSSATDPDGDSVSIMFDWGDGTQSEWSNYIGSGDTVSMTNLYSDSGTYQIMAKAKDDKEAESDWSNVHILEISSRILWTKRYGTSSDDFGYAGQQISDGGYIIAGHTNSGGDYDVYLIKTDIDGNPIWEKTCGGANDDYGYSVHQTSDGGYIIAGYTASSGAESEDVYLVKTDANGNVVWEKTYGGAHTDYGYSVHQTSDGGYIVAGFTASFGAGGGDVYLIKTNADGDTLWTKTYGGTYNDCGYSVQQTSDGGYIVAGYTHGAGGADVYLIKTGVNGDTLWTKTYGGAAWERGNSVKQTSDNGYIIAAGSGDVYLIKTNANGGLIWENRYGGTEADYGHSVQQTSDGGYIVAGYSYSFSEDSDVYVVKTDANGNENWEIVFGYWRDDYGYSIQQISDGAFIVIGTTSTAAYSYEAMLTKIVP